jgi:hypothetical protein
LYSLVDIFFTFFVFVVETKPFLCIGDELIGLVGQDFFEQNCFKKIGHDFVQC